MGKKRKKKKTAHCRKKQSISFEPLILCHISDGQSDYIINEHMKIFENIMLSEHS